uniref:G_PROTEIN_RECEP_F1_2 domain-containing protein n=1 Tax=Rhabditophanes sp. KR3021 TaxID=114890 RepID=A0AC35UCE6_9BILA
MDFEVLYYMHFSFAIFSINVNLLTIYVLIYKTPEEMKFCIRSMMYGRFGDIIISISGGLFMNGYYLFPMPALGYQGFAIYLGEYGGKITIMCLSFGMLLHFFGLLIQYYTIFRSICRKTALTKEIIFYNCLLSFTFMLFLIILYFMVLFFDSDEKHRIELIKEYPQFRNILLKLPKILALNSNNNMYMVVIALFIITVMSTILVFLILYFFVEIFKELQGLKRSKNQASYKKYKTAVIMLVIQLTLPAIFFIIPGSLLGYSFVIAIDFENILQMILLQASCVMIVFYTSMCVEDHVNDLYRSKYIVDELRYFITTIRDVGNTTATDALAFIYNFE